MPHPIADPFVEAVDSDAANPCVRIVSTRAGVATVWINRPAARNAFDSLTIAALHEAFETLKGAEGVRVVFVRGTGGHFSAGAAPEALRLSADLSEADHREDATTLAAMLRTLTQIPALTVALVEGEAFGAAVGLVSACDLAFATADACFAVPEVRLGLVAAVVAPYVVAAIGARAAKRLMALGETIDAGQAERLGLLTRLADDAESLGAIQSAVVNDVMAAAPGAVGETKAAIDEAAGRPIDHALMEAMIRRSARARVGDESREGVAAFLDGRTPFWADL